MATIEKVVEGCLLGEGPHWDPSRQSLFFVDIFGKSISKYTPSTKKLTKASLEKAPSFIIPVENTKDHFVISQSNEIVLISWDGESDKVTMVQTLDSVDEAKSFNDAKCDSLGRLWAGTHTVDSTDFLKTQPLGILYSMDPTKQLINRLEKIRCANGMAFDDKTKKMYYIDTLAGSVDKFDFDITSGKMSNREVWFSLEKSNIPGYPDGMTIDTDGNLWVAIFQGSRVLKICGSKPQVLLDTIDMPLEQVTSMAFGGQNLDELYVTSGAVAFGGIAAPSTKGAVYRVTGTGAKGLPAINFKLNK